MQIEVSFSFISSPVVGRWQLLHHVPHEDEPLVLRGLGRLHKLLVEVISADRIGQLPEIHLEQGGHGVDVLQHGPVVVQVGHPVLVEGDAQLLDVAGDPAQPVDPVDDPALLDEFGAVGQDPRHLLLGVEQVLAQVAAEDALLEDAGLLEFAAGWPREDEGTEEGDQLAVLAEDRLGGGGRGAGAVLR